MRSLLIPALLGLVAACSPSQSGESLATRALAVGQTQTKPVLQTIRYLEQATHDAPRLKGGIESSGIPSLAVLDTERNGVQTWLAEGGQSFALQDGFLRNTRGFGDDLMSSDISQTIAAVLGQRTETVTRHMAFIGPETQLVKREFNCQVDRRGAATVTIDGAGIATTVMSETCRGGDTTFENLYWIRKSDGVIIQSRQWTSEAVGAIVLRDQPL